MRLGEIGVRRGRRSIAWVGRQKEVRCWSANFRSIVLSLSKEFLTNLFMRDGESGCREAHNLVTCYSNATV